MNVANLSYFVKIMVGVSIVLFLYQSIPYVEDYLLWMIIAFFFSCRYDLSAKQQYNQAKGNVIGSIFGLLFWLLGSKAAPLHTESTPLLLLIFIGVACVTLTCLTISLIEVIGTALTCFFVVMLYEHMHSSFEGALMRMVFCLLGCLMSLTLEAIEVKVRQRLE
ncbi:FUSC family protein (plasmid) [Pseudomonas sp. BYT-5]|uniref:FUSC family protein n=1 Tax=Pseudomonas sp. BYT-5 TaxID=2944392 RepID=UPI0020214463|nr:FUSC family protein [Pseudomonas sp. BYT-5]URD45393.1 FUSC family protein [Pseudomonas sp. BYT-5]